MKTKKNKTNYYSLFLVDENLMDHIDTDSFFYEEINLYPIPSFLYTEHFKKLIQETLKETNTTSDKVLYISENPKYLMLAKKLCLNTCFINTGYNDIMNFDPTYEIPSYKRKKRTIEKKKIYSK